MIIFYVVLLGLYVILVARNLIVYKYQVKILNEIYDLSNKDIDNGLQWSWRYEKYNEVPYSKMLLMFWKRLDSFYDNKMTEVQEK